MRNVRNIAVVVFLVLYRKSRMLAVEHNTTVAAMVAHLLEKMPRVLNASHFPGPNPAPSAAPHPPPATNAISFLYASKHTLPLSFQLFAANNYAGVQPLYASMIVENPSRINNLRLKTCLRDWGETSTFVTELQPFMTHSGHKAVRKHEFEP
jgi:hypothetical protein